MNTPPNPPISRDVFPPTPRGQGTQEDPIIVDEEAQDPNIHFENLFREFLNTPDTPPDDGYETEVIYISDDE